MTHSLTFPRRRWHNRSPHPIVCQRFWSLVFALVVALALLEGTLIAVPPKPVATDGRQAANEATVGAVIGVLSQFDMPDALRAEVVKHIRVADKPSRWALSSGNVRLAVVAMPTPTGPVGSPAEAAMLGVAKMLAAKELLVEKEHLQPLLISGLNDEPALREAVATSATVIVGEIRNAASRAEVRDQFAIACVMADQNQINASLQRPESLAAVRVAYRDTLHARIRKDMNLGRWKEAQSTCRHLIERGQPSPALTLDFASCGQKLGQIDEALSTLQSAFERYGKALDADWLELCGEIALNCGPSGEALARRAFEAASNKLLVTTTKR